LRYLAIDCFVAGRPQAEPSWDTHARAICQRNGWDFARVQGPSRTR
jgi:hypothetical protein